MKHLLLILASASVLMAGGFTLKTHDFGGTLSTAQEYNSFGCSGQNISPQLFWSNVPKGTKSFAVTVYDPDAPTGSGWWHWLVVNIPVSVTELPTGVSGKAMPKGAIETENDYGTTGFGGACPPKGDKAHRYIFTVYALDVESLPVKAKTNAPIVGYQINAHTLQKASIISYYKR